MARLIQNYVYERKTVPFYSELDVSSPELLCSLPESRDESQLSACRELSESLSLSLISRWHPQCDLRQFQHCWPAIGRPHDMVLANQNRATTSAPMEVCAKCCPCPAWELTSLVFLLPGNVGTEVNRNNFSDFRKVRQLLSAPPRINT